MTKYQITFPPEVYDAASEFQYYSPRAAAFQAAVGGTRFPIGSALVPSPRIAREALDALAAAVAEHAIIEPVPPTPITPDQIVKGMTVVVTSDGWTLTAQADHQDADGDWLDADDGYITTGIYTRTHTTYATYDELPASPAERMAAALGVEPGAIRQALTDAGLDLSEWKP